MKLERCRCNDLWVNLVFTVSLYATQILLVAASPVGSNQPSTCTTSRRLLTRVSKLGTFSWNASLNETTGIASSREKSSFVIKSFRSDSDLAQSTESLLSSYVAWLVQPTITFGVLRQGCSGTAIKLRFGKGVTLLSFQRPNVARTFQHQKLESVTSSFSIRGGLFALHGPRNDVKGSRLENDGMGRLCLALRYSNQERGVKGVQIYTELVGYRPWLAGHAPVHPIRKWMYLSTQSFVHAYVMWRFHRHVSRSMISSA